jgi:hypothetical protein
LELILLISADLALLLTWLLYFLLLFIVVCGEVVDKEFETKLLGVSSA